MNLRVFDSLEDLAGAAASLVVARAEKHPSVIALSGGSTPRTLYEILGSGSERERLARQKVHWLTGDERCVPPDHADSNSRMIEKTLFRDGIPPDHSFLRFKTETGSPAEIAHRFEREWREQGIFEINIAILGMGDDGHTASLFPETPVLDVDDRTASEVFVPRLQSWRLTLTVPILRAAALKIVLVSGASKREALARAQRDEQIPIVRVTEGEGECWWFVDREAYGE